MNNFDLKKYLSENKLTSNSKLLSENSSQTIEYKGKKYYIENPKGKERVFAYSDPQLQQVAKVNGKTLMFKTEDVEDMLIKEEDSTTTPNKRNTYQEISDIVDDNEGNLGDITDAIYNWYKQFNNNLDIHTYQEISDIVDDNQGNLGDITDALDLWFRNIKK
jgi:hypothetical protein